MAAYSISSLVTSMTTPDDDPDDPPDPDVVWGALVFPNGSTSGSLLLLSIVGGPGLIIGRMSTVSSATLSSSSSSSSSLS
eukprot:CAMPEP_0170950478 /NCGR_PEP_ID=MMETSP0735-20130129/30002_1 /TAXON_ID=186038 /ORGANISM="Fragilariopsis kerguelensis, Strain L26-C5" /LENGTH=79 /DNA_ID=CAMNT_0011360955 /DNA_START=1 /DNA_END=240 /DNA_ORIENTATION=+